MRAILRAPAVLAAALAAGLLLARPALAADGDEIGRLIAEQFAKDGKSAKSSPAGATRQVVPAQAPAADDEARMLEEIEMLERARAEAEARRDALAKARETAEQTEAAEARRAAADVAKAEARRAEERRQAEEAERAVETARKAEAAALARMQAEREAEADRIDEALRKAREARAAQRSREEPRPEPAAASEEETVADAPGSPWRDEAPAAREALRDAVPWPAPRDAANERTALGGPYPHANRRSTRVTVLLAMLPGHRGIRRHSHTGDPILCGEQGCYVSAGASEPADLMPLRRAFGIRRTLGERAGACSNTLGCVFRGVDLGAFPAILQPVDMRLLKHDRRQPLVLHEPSSCRLAGRDLECTALHGPDYTMWIVPEDVAEAAGPDALERIVDDSHDGHGPRVFVRN